MGPGPPRPALRGIVYALAGGGAVVVCVSLVVAVRQPVRHPALLIAAVVMTGFIRRFPVFTRKRGSQTRAIHLDEAALIVLLAEFSLAQAVLLFVLTDVIALRRSGPLRTAFNLGSDAIGAGLAGLLAMWLPLTTVTGAVCGALAYAVFTNVTTSGAVAVAGGERFRDVVSRDALLSVLALGVAVGAGAASALLARANLAWALLPMPVVGLATFTAAAQQAAVRDRDRLAALLDLVAGAQQAPTHEVFEAMVLAVAQRMAPRLAVTAGPAAEAPRGARAFPLDKSNSHVMALIVGPETRAEMTPSDDEMLSAISSIAGAALQTRRFALEDALTGLANRVLLERELERAVALAGRSGLQVAVIYVDLDGFKAINDVYGHDVGDEVLRVVANRFRAIVRSVDVVGRRGGDEFVVILPAIAHVSDPDAVANKLVAVARHPVHVGGIDAHIGASVGVAVFPADGSTGNELLAAADAAMYVAKRTGKGRVAHARAGLRASNL